MVRRLRLDAFGSCAVVIALLCGGGLARATVTSLSVDHKAVASADHTVVTVTGILVCTKGDTAQVAADVVQAKSGTLGFGATPPPGFICTGSAQPYSVDVPVAIPAGGEYDNGPATGIVDAVDITDGTDQVAIAKLVITGANNH